jgi:multidrug resistance efflux pump
MPAKRLELRARTEGLLVEAPADEGTRVHAGDVVARLENQELEAALHRARAEVERLTAAAAKTRAGPRAEEIARARALVDAREQSLAVTERAATRRSALFEQRLVGAEDQDRSQRDRAEKTGELALARAELDLLRAGSRREDLASAEAELRRARVELADMERRQALLTLTSPMDGVVVTPRFHEHLHQLYQAGSKVLEVADLSRARVEIYVPEREFDVLALGQPTTVKVQSFPLHPFHGRVEFVSLAVTEVAGERVVRVETGVDNGEGLLRESMTGFGEIEAGRTRLINIALRRLVRWIRLRFLI